jgi:hypothetical protein
MNLFRPVGLAELALIFDSEMKAFPPRLPDQPIFYPVMNREYAIQIARDWNAPSEQSGFAGYVTEFKISSDYLKQFPVQTVGASLHQELWVPAEQLNEFNSKIEGTIQVTDAFFGSNFKGFIPDQFGLRAKNAVEQFVALSATFNYSGMDFICETAANRKCVWLNFLFCEQRDFTNEGISVPQRDRVLKALRELWKDSKRSPALPDSKQIANK